MCGCRARLIIVPIFLGSNLTTVTRLQHIFLLQNTFVLIILCCQSCFDFSPSNVAFHLFGCLHVHGVVWWGLGMYMWRYMWKYTMPSPIIDQRSAAVRTLSGTKDSNFKSSKKTHCRARTLTRLL